MRLFRALTAAALLALACGSEPAITAPHTALAAQATPAQSDAAWSCMMTAWPYADTTAMGQQWDACVGPRTTTPAPPPQGSPIVLAFVGPSTGGQVYQQMGLVLNPQLSALDLFKTGLFGNGQNCTEVPSGYVLGGLRPAGHIYTPGRSAPACLGGYGRGVVKCWAHVDCAVSMTALWATHDRLAVVWGPPSHVWWVIADHKDHPASDADLLAVYDRIRQRWPAAPIIVTSITALIPPQRCQALGGAAYSRSDQMTALALTLPNTMPGPAFSYPANTSSWQDDCHYGAFGMDQEEQGRQLRDFIAALGG